MQSGEYVNRHIEEVIGGLPLDEVVQVYNLTIAAQERLAAVGLEGSAAELENASGYARKAHMLLMAGVKSLRFYMGDAGYGSDDEHSDAEVIPGAIQPDWRGVSVAQYVLSRANENSDSDKHPLESLQNVEWDLKWKEVLSRDESLFTKTTGQMLTIADQIIDAKLLNLASKSSEGWPRLRVITGIVGIEARRELGAKILQRIGEMPCYQIFDPSTVELIADTLTMDTGDDELRLELIQMVCDSACTKYDIQALCSYGVLSNCIAVAGKALLLRDPTAREEQGITEVSYQEYAAAARAARNMFARVGDTGIFLSYKNQEIIDRLCSVED